VPVCLNLSRGAEDSRLEFGGREGGILERGRKARKNNGSAQKREKWGGVGLGEGPRKKNYLGVDFSQRIAGRKKGRKHGREALA